MCPDLFVFLAPSLGHPALFVSSPPTLFFPVMTLADTHPHPTCAPGIWTESKVLLQRSICLSKTPREMVPNLPTAHHHEPSPQIQNQWPLKTLVVEEVQRISSGSLYTEDESPEGKVLLPKVTKPNGGSCVAGRSSIQAICRERDDTAHAWVLDANR